MTFLLIIWLLQSSPVAFENEYVRVMRDSAPCASATAPGCGDRVIVALGEIELRSGGGSRKVTRKMTRGDIAVFKPGESYEPPKGGAFFEVAFKANHPPVESPREIIPPEKNSMRYEGERFFIFEERLDPGDTRPRHSHSQRVVVQLNRTRLQQWPEGGEAIIRDIVPDRAGFNPPVIHTVKNVGDAPLRGIVIEFKAEQRKRLPQ